MSKERDPVIREAATASGGFSGLAEKLGLTYQAVWNWRRVPSARVLDVEEVTGISRERLRPDLYGAPRPRPKRRPSMSAAA